MESAGTRNRSSSARLMEVYPVKNQLYANPVLFVDPSPC
jgi:hypothetical protein